MPNPVLIAQGPETLVSRAGESFFIQETEVILLAGGGYVVLWEQRTTRFGTSEAIAARIFDAAGNPVGNAFSITTDSSENYSLAAEATPDGGFVVVYTQGGASGFGGGNGSYRMFMRHYSETGQAAGPPVQLRNSTVDDERDADIAILQSGNYVITWSNTGFGPTTSTGAKYQLFAPDGTPLSTARDAGGLGFLAPEVVALSNGGFAIVYQTGGSDFLQGSVSVRIFDASGNPMTEPLPVDAVGSGAEGFPAITTLSSGGFVITWEGTGDDVDIFAQVFDVNGNPVAPGFRVNDSTSARQSDPSVSMHPAGGFVVTWNTAPGEIAAQVYADDGTRLGDNFMANEPGSPGSEGSPSLAAMADGSLRFAWGSFVMDTLRGNLEIRTRHFDWDPSHSGTDGDDIVRGALDSDRIAPGAGVDFVYGYAGDDTVTYQGSSSGVNVYLDAGHSWDGTSMDFLFSIEHAAGSAHDDLLVGNANANLLDGGAGGLDFLHGGGGSDTASYNLSQRGVTIDLTAQYSWDGLTMDFFTSIENAIGSAVNDVIYGDGGDNLVDGGTGGVDFLFGQGGNDTVSYLSSAAGVDINLGTKRSWDGTSTDFFESIENAIGSSFADSITGDSGANRLNGGSGNDILFGGAGADRFEFFTGDGSRTGHDTILDFEAGTDKLVIDDDIGTLRSFGDVASHSVQNGADLVITIGSVSTIRLSGVELADLTAADFIFI